MKQTWLKVRYEGAWSKISLLQNIARLIRLETIYYGGGSGRGEL